MVTNKTNENKHDCPRPSLVETGKTRLESGILLWTGCENDIQWKFILWILLVRIPTANNILNILRKPVKLSPKLLYEGFSKLIFRPSHHSFCKCCDFFMKFENFPIFFVNKYDFRSLIIKVFFTNNCLQLKN